MKIDVIIPVGPGHEQLYKRAANSVGVAAKYYFSRFPDGAIEDVGLRVMDDTEGKHGRARARNDGVKESSANWIFFLDADDEMHPEAICTFAEELRRQAGLDALWGQIVESVGQWLELPRTQIPEIHSHHELIRFPAHMTLQMGHFVRREVAKRHPFRESMDVGEDFDYYLRVWKVRQCVKVRKPLMINHRGQHSVGPRSANGAEWTRVVSAMLKDAREIERGEAA